MTFGLHIGHMGGPLPEMRRLWKFADDMGFDWFSVSDHFQESPPQGGDLDCFEAVTTMTAAVLETKRVRIGSLVYCINYRNPGVLAAALTTVDHLSNGRLECGIGAGWHAHEYEAFGIPFEKIGVREDMLEEYAQCLRKLFDPAHKVRLWIGGGGEKRTLRAVARYADGWNIPYQSPAAFKAKSLILDEWCAKEKRDPATIARTVNAGFYIGADERGAARGEALYQSHFGKDPRGGFLRGTAKQALEMVGAYREAGVERLNIGLRQGPYDWEALHAYAEVVLPAFGAKRPA